MLQVRNAVERGHANHGWLDSYHSFSFADYYDPEHMGYSALRVINEDRVVPAAGFPTHAHRDMEIVTYVLAGALEHRDSMGNGSIIAPGDVQRMSAGTGVTHSEFNASKTEPVHFLQIWVLPARRGLPPSYEQKQFPELQKRAQLRLIAAPDGADGAVTIHQDAFIYATVLQAGERVAFQPRAGRHVYIHVARGAMTINGTAVGAGDGVRIVQENEISLDGRDTGEALLFDLP